LTELIYYNDFLSNLTVLSRDEVAIYFLFGDILIDVTFNFFVI